LLSVPVGWSFRQRGGDGSRNRFPAAYVPARHPPRADPAVVSRAK
jgi:hypothetical protein